MFTKSFSATIILALCSLSLHGPAFPMDYSSISTTTGSPLLFRITATTTTRTIFLDGTPFEGTSSSSSRTLQRYPIDTSDMTQSYSYLDSQDLPDIERRVFPHHDLDNEHCVPMADWQSMIFPTCNGVHELDMESSVQSKQALILSNRGFWRTAWEYVENMTVKNTSQYEFSMVLKTFKLDHAMEEAFFEQTRVDALAMERLTKSKHVVGIYAHCGMTILTEFAGQDINVVSDQRQPMDRLLLAKDLAQGIADIHDVGMVHNDVNFANLVYSQNNKVAMVNDFNLSILRMKHNQTGEACPFTSVFPNPMWRAPEEQREEDGSFHPVLDEKIDVYALGNVLFRFATGVGPWKKEGSPRLSSEEKAQVESLKREGQLPPFPKTFSDLDDPAIDAMLEIMRKCYAFDPIERPSAKQVVGMLQSAITRISA